MRIPTPPTRRVIRGGQWFTDFAIDHGATSHFQFNCTHLAIDAALSGHGIALVDRSMVLDELQKGHLICPTDHSLTMKTGYYLVYRQTALRIPAVSDFRQWALKEARSARLDMAGAKHGLRVVPTMPGPALLTG